MDYGMAVLICHKSSARLLRVSAFRIISLITYLVLYRMQFFVQSNPESLLGGSTQSHTDTCVDRRHVRADYIMERHTHTRHTHAHLQSGSSSIFSGSHAE